MNYSRGVSRTQTLCARAEPNALLRHVGNVPRQRRERNASPRRRSGFLAFRPARENLLALIQKLYVDIHD